MKKKEKKNKKKIIDLRRFFVEKNSMLYDDGEDMRTGMPSEYYYDDIVNDYENEL